MALPVLLLVAAVVVAGPGRAQGTAAPPDDLLRRAGDVMRATWAPSGVSDAEQETVVYGVLATRRRRTLSVVQERSRLTWWRDGTLRQALTDARSRQVAATADMARSFRTGWLHPAPFADQFRLRRPDAAVEDGTAPLAWAQRLLKRLVPAPETLAVAHPLGRDAVTRYRVERVDTVPWTDVAGAASAGRVLSLWVVPRDERDDLPAVVRGEIWLDPATLALRRLRVRVERAASARMRVLPWWRREPLGYLDLRFAPTEGGGVMPAHEVLRLPSGAGLAEERIIVQRVTRYAVVSVDHAARDRPTDAIPFAVTTRVAEDSAHGWSAALGTANEGVPPTLWDDLLPEHQRQEERSRWHLQARSSFDLYRFNKIEGLFTGIGVRRDGADPEAGWRVGAQGGWAWSEQTARGSLTLSRRWRGWSLWGHAAQELELTNDFRSPYDQGSRWAAMLLSSDNYDYVARRSAGLTAIRVRGDSALTVRLSAGRAADAMVTNAQPSGVVGAAFRPNRAVDAGTYWQSAAIVEWQPLAWDELASERLGMRASYERGDGGLSFGRWEGTVLGKHRADWGLLVGRISAGALHGTPVRQQLFELGETQHLPGYPYKAFAGDRSWIAAGNAIIPLRVLRREMRFVSGFSLPGLAPDVSVGVQAGRAWASSAAARTAVDGLGRAFDRASGRPQTDPSTGAPLPAAVSSDRVRATVDIGLRFWSGAMFGALAMPVDGAPDRPSGPRLVFGFAQRL